MGKKIDLTGQRFGRLVVLRECGRSKSGKVLWKCHCDCGNECVVSGDHLRRGKATSCGCHKRDTVHGLCVAHKRLYGSIWLHFRRLREGAYKNWKLDARYTNDTNGVVKFCQELIKLQPRECAKYETDTNLVPDKDDDTDKIFRPETIKFVTCMGNGSNRVNTCRLKDDTPFTVFCRLCGIPTIENKRMSSEYNRCKAYFLRHNGAGHPELLKKANELVALYSKCLKLLKLRDEVRQLAEQVKAL